ncbi:MAG: MBL fold metallo-hydrolase [Nitrospirota bacterium]
MSNSYSIKEFSSSDLIKYLEIELYHSLEKYNIKEHIDNYLEDRVLSDGEPTTHIREFYEIINDFYDLLLKLRYSTSIPEEITPREYSDDQYDDFVITKYDEYIKRLDELTVSIFSDNFYLKDIIPVNGTADTLEACLIYNIYDIIQSNLRIALKAYRKPPNKRTTDDNLTTNYDKLDKGVPKLIVERFIIGKENENKIATQSEKCNYNCGLRILLNKQRRYAGNDRASYWKLFISDIRGEVIFTEIHHKAEAFLIQKSSESYSWMVEFLLLILAKYHIIIHRLGTNEFRNLQQHVEKAEKGDKLILRAQKVFTFIRLIAKYFPNIFDRNNLRQSQEISKIIEIISYIRRGFAFEMLGKPENAFNDYSSAEKQTTGLQATQPGGAVAWYQKLTVPYIYSLKGELYRKNFAFYNAHQYFCNSMSKFKEVSSLKDEEDVKEGKETKEKKELKELLDSCIKIGRIQIAKGKTFLELGEFRKALKWYIKALQHLLRTITGNYEAIDFSEEVKHFDDTRLDPKINKKKMYDILSKFTENVNSIIKYENLEQCNDYAALISELFNLIGFIIYIFNLPDFVLLENIDAEPDCTQSLEELEVDKKILCRNLLAGRWLLLALKFNPQNYLARFNELIIDLETKCEKTRAILEEEREELGIPTRDKEAKIDLMTPGEPRDIMYRLIAKEALEFLWKPEKVGKIDKKKEIAKELINKLLLYTDDFSTRNAELYKYLMRPERLKKEDEIRFHFLQRWSSINPAVPRPSAFKMKGGGYFLTFKGRGIAIDPGINFVENLYSEGFSIADVHYIIATHDHIDHIAEIDTIMSLHYKRCKVDETQKRTLYLILNPSVSVRYEFMVNQSPSLFKKIELTPHVNEMKIFDNFTIEAKQVFHRDICSPIFANSLGLILKFFPGNNKKEFKIGIIGDTRYREQRNGTYFGAPISDQFMDSDILIAHINGTPFRELKAYCGITLDNRKLRQLLEELDKKGKRSHPMRPIINQLKYSLGYKIEDSVALIFDPIKRLNNELHKLDGEHMFLHGILGTYGKFISEKTDKDRLFIVAETSEEMGSYRHKVAMLLNEYYKQTNDPKCLTGDIGMTIRVKPGTDNRIEVRCNRCNLNNDYTDDDKFHNLENITEVCLKWEEEGLIYYCRRHDPESVNRKVIDFGFAERIERYHPFRHIEIRVS